MKLGYIEDGSLFSNQAIRSVVEEMFIEGEQLLRIHTAWQLKNGQILLYEYSPRNSPASNFCFIDCMEDYNELCNELKWVHGK
ncbi:hypothetical protein [Paenibacillus nasutitermitis]|uniref:Uncharacterized protein n=1 Tax=Paenibacillus nasutitermitis TaxID=1652958 RepID=A0A917DRX9_9BACL|nr:hypothetical protein [Paenibacillus nasutitermitis]GGD60930.1 hypothetical protein GCM10010911_18490 [Paenibacillus nasutitermitis]